MPATPLFSLGIRQKVVLVLVCVLMVALGTSTWFTLSQQEDNVMRETRRHGEDLTRIVSQTLAYSVVGYDYHTIQLLLDQITRTHDIGYAKVLSGKGNTMAEAGRLPEVGNSWTMFAEDILFDNRKVGHLVIGLDNREIIERLRQQRSSALAREVMIILFIALAEFLALSWIIIRPVSLISRALDRGVDAAGQILHRIPLVSRDEFGRLATQFNDMREQLNQANAQLQSEIDLADAQLTDNNRRLLEQAVELQRMNRELQQIAITDALTGLYNRRYFDQVTESELALSARHGDPSSIVLIDIDHFKRINDTYGHDAGDKVLIELGAVLGGCLRESDLACRVGGEEFVVLCRRTGSRESHAVGEKIRVAIERHAFVDATGRRIPVTVSVGIATFPDAGQVLSMKDYSRKADLALYCSKTSGRNCVTHYSQLSERETG
jgi:diguanylate cyclase (GGDEF)-like protein